MNDWLPDFELRKKNLQPEKLLKNGLFVSDEDNEVDDVTGCSDLYKLFLSSLKSQ